MMDAVKEAPEREDALIAIAARNQFYKNKYHIALGIYFLSLLVIVILAFTLFYLSRSLSHPIYFVTDDVGRLIVDVPVTQPNMPTAKVSDWVVEAIEAAYSYDFINYRDQLQSAQKYFTEYGWRTYMEELNFSNNLIAVNERKMIAIARVAAKPKLIIEGILSGAYAYKFEMPVLITYLLPPYDENIDKKSKFQNALTVSVIVQRQNILKSYQGLGIVQSIGKLLVSTTPQNLSNAPG